MKKQKSFVFVVCGAEEHINTLNLSLKALQSQTGFPVLVVTDLQRNDLDINHDEDRILDIQTPQEYNHHQASIYLKTGLHRFLPMEKNLYCYLDTDVVALNHDVSKIFDHYTSPITFAADHCKMNGFSPQAVNCGCAAMLDELQGLIDNYSKQFGPLLKNQSKINRILTEWHTLKEKHPLEQAKNDWFDGLLKDQEELRTKRTRLLNLTDPSLPLSRLIFNYLFRVFPKYRRSITTKQWKDLDGNILLDEGPDYHLFMNQRGFFYDNQSGLWKDGDGQPTPELPIRFDEFFAKKDLFYDNMEGAWYSNDGSLFLPNIVKLIERESQCSYEQETNTWYDKTGNHVFTSECNHLQQAIEDDFNVEVIQDDWQHWNGGVFLFDTDSIPFLNNWHELTLKAFSIPNWKTRDQGTLITTVWKFGLQNQPVLSPQFNFIADYHHPTMTYDGNLAFRLGNSEPTIYPSFIHIYHHWGDRDWNVWVDVENHVLTDL